MVVVNASNLHVGGGVQVAVSFFYEMAKVPEYAVKLNLWISNAVMNNLSDLDVDLSVFHSVKVFDVHGYARFPSDIYNALPADGVIFTLFGPLYSRIPGWKSVVGFAQPWISYPNNECYAMLSLFSRMKSRLKYRLQGYFFKKNSDILVVELEHVKRSLLEVGLKDGGSIFVVRNSISGLYRDFALTHPISAGSLRKEDGLKIGYLGRNYFHKNTKILPDVKRFLDVNHKLSGKFYVTFNDEEWSGLPEGFREGVSNAGSLSVEGCLDYYREMDAIIFPSLLECFSATPLESMAMGKPVFVSDTPFNRDVCGDCGIYFNPHDPSEAAFKINEFFEKPVDFRQDFLRLAREHALNFSSPAVRARKYFEIIDNGVRNVR